MKDHYELKFDINDQPYLVHAEGSEWKQHKYIMKIPKALPDGSDLYLYTQREVDAWMNHGRRTVGNRIKDALGFDERDARNDAQRMYSYRQQQMRTVNSKTAGKPNLSKNEKDMWMRANERVKSTKSVYEESESKYRKTLLGRLESFGDALKKLVSGISSLFSPKAKKVIAENADVKMTEVNKALAASQNAAIDAGTQTSQKTGNVPTSVAKNMAASQNAAIDAGTQTSQKTNAQTLTEEERKKKKKEYENSLASMPISALQSRRQMSFHY